MLTLGTKAQQESLQDHLTTQYEPRAHQETGFYETQGDHVTDADGWCSLWNDECISLDDVHINAKKTSASV